MTFLALPVLLILPSDFCGQDATEQLSTMSGHQ